MSVPTPRLTAEKSWAEIHRFLHIARRIGPETAREVNISCASQALRNRWGRFFPLLARFRRLHAFLLKREFERIQRR